MPEMSKSVGRKPKVIGIVGSRRRNSVADYLVLLEKFRNVWKPGDRIVSGGCPQGGDKFAERIAREGGLTITVHHADWDGPDGRKAGFIRNTLISRDCDVLIALVAEDRTGGTEDTVRKALEMGKEVIVL